MAFYAYILRCNDGSYYTGHTDDIDVRLAQHQQGTLGGYTAKRRPVVLVWTDMFPSRDEAFAAERRLKGVEPGEEGSADCRRLGAHLATGA